MPIAAIDCFLDSGLYITGTKGFFLIIDPTCTDIEAGCPCLRVKVVVYYVCFAFIILGIVLEPYNEP